MSLSPRIELLFIDQFTLFASAGVDEYGQISHAATGTSFSCSIQYAKEVTTDSEGRDVVSAGKIYTTMVPSVTTSSKITIAGAYVPILDVKVLKDDTGSHHQVITFGNALKG